MSALPSIRVEPRKGGAVVWLWLSRPAVHNALDSALLSSLAASLRAHPRPRAYVLAGSGRSFCAGADLSRAPSESPGDSAAAARVLRDALDAIRACGAPVVARVHGAALGGGAGIVAACDVALCSSSAVFAFGEPRLGLQPALIAPHVVGRCGARRAGRYFVTGERFGPQEALRIGLVDSVLASESDLDTEVERVCGEILKCSPDAVAECKDLVGTVESATDSATLAAELERRFVHSRQCKHGKAGIAAFLNKSKPAWFYDE
eukprot:m51a1_g3258 putative enoyl-CoA hydratase (262) ;mRNA; f:188905-189830